MRASAPGRVNLIGEHTDYNGGFVMPVAIGQHTIVDASKRDDRVLFVRSDNVAGDRRFELDALQSAPQGDWSDYVRGVAYELERSGVALAGAELHVSGNVPLGAGLSSSAALEIAAALALLSISGSHMEPEALALLAQRAENEHTGTRCGIMDQLIATCGIANHALLIDTRSLERRALPISPQTSIVACNTMVRHALASSAYNDRRAECELAARVMGLRTLRDATLGELDAVRERLGDVLFRRARHVISENTRVLDAASALDRSDAVLFGTLMNRSHASLRDDFQVSCEELDIMVDIAQSFEGTYGARMTGGGFGGCTVNLVARDRRDAFVLHVGAAYQKRTGKTPEIYTIEPSKGATVEEA